VRLSHPACRESIVLKKPTIVERFDYMERCGFDLDGQGQMQAAGNKLKTTIKLVELSLPHYVSVAIKKDDGTEDRIGRRDDDRWRL
jgi:hypothetical protein